MDIQIKMLHSIPGLEKVRIIRPGYAIEYDYADPIQLQPFLETKIIENLFLPDKLMEPRGTKKRPLKD